MFKFLSKLIGSETDESEAARADAGADLPVRETRKPAAAAPARGDRAAAPKPARTVEANDRAEAGQDHFDPYNTGTFDRGASWERVRKRNP